MLIVTNATFLMHTISAHARTSSGAWQLCVPEHATARLNNRESEIFMLSCRFILTRGSAPRLCQFWTPSSMTSLRRLPMRPLLWLATPKSPLWHPGRSRQQSGLSCLESWPSMPSLRAPRPLQSSPLKWTPLQTTPGDLNHHQCQISLEAEIRNSQTHSMVNVLGHWTCKTTIW